MIMKFVALLYKVSCFSYKSQEQKAYYTAYGQLAKIWVELAIDVQFEFSCVSHVKETFYKIINSTEELSPNAKLYGDNLFSESDDELVSDGDDC